MQTLYEFESDKSLHSYCTNFIERKVHRGRPLAVLTTVRIQHQVGFICDVDRCQYESSPECGTSKSFLQWFHL